MKKQTKNKVVKKGEIVLPAVFSESQRTIIDGKTPAQFVKQRKGRGGLIFDYVEIGYMQWILNKAFGHNWDFEITDREKDGDNLTIFGKLIVRDDKGNEIKKTNCGGAEIKYLKGTKTPVDIANDWKSAVADCLKKCASMLGFSMDVYSPVVYNELMGIKNKVKKIENVKTVSDNSNISGQPITDKQISYIKSLLKEARGTTRLGDIMLACNEILKSDYRELEQLDSIGASDIIERLRGERQENIDNSDQDYSAESYPLKNGSGSMAEDDDRWDKDSK